MYQLCFLFPLYIKLCLLSAYIKSSFLLKNAKGIDSEIHKGLWGVWLVGWFLENLNIASDHIHFFMDPPATAEPTLKEIS